MAAGMAIPLGGCFGPDLSADPLVGGEAASPERVAAVAEIRQRAEAVEEQPYPKPFQADRTARLAARAEPRRMADVDEIEAELAAIAQLQQTASTPEERAELQARADELRRKADEDQSGRIRP
jgi:hypothetical protein